MSSVFPKSGFQGAIRAVVFAVLILTTGILGSVIGSVSVVGEKNTSEGLIKSTSGLVEGERYAPALLEDAVRKVYGLGFFDDVEIRGVKNGDKVDLEIEVVEFPLVSKILFDGNKKIKEKDLLDKSGLVLNDFLSPAKTFHAVKNIREEYAKKGFPKVEIETEALETQPGRVSLTLKIDEGVEIRVGRIDFHGNEAFSDSKLRRQFKTKQKSLFRSGKFTEDQYREDLDKLLEFYRNEGYITAKILQDSVLTDTTDARLNIDVWLEEGKKYYFGNVDVTGNTIYKTDEVLGQLKFESGDVFSGKKLDDSVAEIYFLYQEKGYIYANVRDIRRLSADTVYLNLSITEGKQAHVRKIEIVGNTRTFDRVVRREMNIYPGEVFHRSKMMRSVRNIYYLNYFNDVVPDFDILDDGDVDLVMNVEEKPIGRFQIGGTYNSRDKLVGNISIGWPNMLGRGWEGEFTWEFGANKKNLSLSFTEPWLLGTPTTVGIDLYNTESVWSGLYTELRTGGSLRLGRRLSWPDDYFSIYWRYTLEQIKYYDFSSSYYPTPEYDLRNRDWPQTQSSSRAVLQRDSRDSKLFASRGTRNTYTIEFAGNFLGGDVTYQKQDFSSDWYFPLHKYLTLVVKGKLGYLSNAFGEDPDDVPFSERYFFGSYSYGGQVRGYTDRAISPIDTAAAEYDSSATPDIAGRVPLVAPEESFRLGGRAMAQFTTELRIPISRDQFYISFFGDAGNTWRSLDEVDFGTLKRGAGAGVRLVVPMLGVMGVDVGYGFDKNDLTEEVSGWQWHFQIGPE
ncbi:outer membrane protein assembly factor BamA [bacterium]|nr:outer membrane protein assembly factor BamA [bacterium]